jgi:phosphoglycolate phosphatase
MKYTTILFDFDGTMVDSSRIILPCVQNTYRELGMELPSKDILRKFIGPPLNESFKIIGMPEELINKAVGIYRSTFNNKNYEDFLLYPGMRELLTHLQKEGVRLAVASVRLEDKLQEVCIHMDIDRYFEAVCGKVDAEGVLTKEDVVRRALQKLGNPAGQAVLIGDSTFDEEGARQAEIDFVGVLYGFGFVAAKDVHQSVFIANSVGDLAGFIAAN